MHRFFQIQPFQISDYKRIPERREFDFGDVFEDHGLVFPAGTIIDVYHSQGFLEEEIARSVVKLPRELRSEFEQNQFYRENSLFVMANAPYMKFQGEGIYPVVFIDRNVNPENIGRSYHITIRLNP